MIATMDLHPYVGSLVLWMMGTAAAVYASKVVRPRLPTTITAVVSAYIRLPQDFALFLVGMTTLLVMIEPIHFAGLGAAEIVNRWQARLPFTAGAGLVAAMLSGLLDHVRPLRAAFALAWPPAAYAAMAWTIFLWLRHLIPPGDAPNLSELVGYARPFLTLLTAYPAVAFACGAAGAAVGRAIGPIARPGAK